MVRYYREAHDLQRKMKNQELWIQGAYVYDAILCTAPVLHPFAKRGVKAVPYLTEPYPIDKEEADQRQIEAERKEQQKIRDRLMSFAAVHNAKKR